MTKNTKHTGRALTTLLTDAPAVRPFNRGTSPPDDYDRMLRDLQRIDKLPLKHALFELTDEGVMHWLKRGTWTPDEAALLLSGVNPLRVEGFADDPYTPADYDLSHRAFVNLLRSWPECRIERKPGEWVAWAHAQGWHIPAPLLVLLAAPDDTPEQADTQPQAGNDAPKVETPESKEQRQDRRLKACEDAGLVMPALSVGRLPDGIGRIAGLEGVKRQSFTSDVKAALKRREAITKLGRVVHRA